MLLDKKLVIFDLDGVLTDSSQHHFDAWRALVLKHFSTRLPSSFETQLKGVSRSVSLQRILDYIQRNTLSDAEKKALMDEKNQHYQSLIAQVTSHDLCEGALPLLNHLKTHNVLLALGSASRNGSALLKSLEIEHYFDLVVDPAPLRSKPAPDIFTAAMVYFNLTPDQCVGIEDAVAGVTAIKAAKMTAIGIGDAADLAHADQVFKTLQDLTKVSLKES